MTDLFAPYQLGDLTLSNRLVMAPLTRNRAGEGGVPTPLVAEYYAQRAGAGLIVSEGTQPSAIGQGYPNTPGLHTDDQVDGWRAVADAVHARGGRIVAQLMHAGRISHPDVLGGAQPVAPSAVTPAGQVFTGTDKVDFVEPRALATEELPGVVAEFVDAARRAVEAGLDGVELHAANGYLLQQFLGDNSNRRTDVYGGSPANRARFVVEVATAVAEAVGPGRVGIRISPDGTAGDIAEVETEATYHALLEGLAPLGLLYLHVLASPGNAVAEQLRQQWTGPFVLNTGFTGPSDLETAQQAVDSGATDLFSIGRPFLANPDLVDRLRTGAALNEPDADTFYGGGAQGYTDYPTLEQRDAA